MKISGIIYASAMMALMVSCGSTSQTVATTEPVAAPVAAKSGPVERTVGKEVIALAEADASRRSWGSASHFQEATAIRTAEANARGRFATAMQSMIKTGLESYANAVSAQSGSSAEVAQQRAEDLTSRLDDYISAVSSECVKNSVAIKTQSYDTENSQILVYVCIEYRQDVGELVKTVKQKLEQSIPDDIKEQIAFDKFVHQRSLDDAFANYKPVSDEE